MTAVPDADAFLLPDPDEHSAPFWDACRREQLTVQECGECGRLRFPPRPMCPRCRSLAHRWVPLSGRGRIWSFVVVHRPVLAAYEAFLPYPVVVVELEEDPQLRMVGNVVARPGAAINSVDPAELHIGRPLTVTFEQVTDDITLPRWMLAVPAST